MKWKESRRLVLREGSGLKAAIAVRHTGLRTKNHCAGEDQHQYSRQAVVVRPVFSLNMQKCWKQNLGPETKNYCAGEGQQQFNWPELLVPWSFHCPLFGRRDVRVSVSGWSWINSQVDLKRVAGRVTTERRRDVALCGIYLCVCAIAQGEAGCSYCLPIIYWHGPDISHPAHNQQVLEFIGH
jgi:hypothetical protein